VIQSVIHRIQYPLNCNDVSGRKLTECSMIVHTTTTQQIVGSRTALIVMALSGGFMRKERLPSLSVLYTSHLSTCRMSHEAPTLGDIYTSQPVSEPRTVPHTKEAMSGWVIMSNVGRSLFRSCRASLPAPTWYCLKRLDFL
jgi:hypothetical protein